MSERAEFFIPEIESQDIKHEEVITSTSTIDNIEKTSKVGAVRFHKSVLCMKKNCKYFQYEADEEKREKVKTSLLNQLGKVVTEYYERVRGDAVIISVASDSEASTFHIVGTERMKTIARDFLVDISKDMRQAMETINEVEAENEDPLIVGNADLFQLPPLCVDDTPIALGKMTQAHLRAFVPLMLKYSLGRGKPGWGRDELRPIWWPKDVPWANVRKDMRPLEEKQKVSWSDTLRRIVRCCYEFHGRLDLIGNTVTTIEMFDQGEEAPREDDKSTISILTPDGPVPLYCTILGTMSEEDEYGNTETTEGKESEEASR